MKDSAMNILKNIVKVTVAGSVSLLLLSLFCLVYLNTGIHIRNETGATDYKWESRQRKASMTEGFAWLRMDEDGFNNSFPPQKDVDILLMGSSHMEAVNVPDTQNTGYLLNELLPEFYTYNIGTSGHTIYACANNLSAAVEYYRPQGYTVIETDRIDLDIESMEKVLNGEYQQIKSYDTGLIYLLQKYVPVIKNIYKQMDDWWDSDSSTTKQDATEEGTEADSVTEEYSAVLDRFLAFIREGSDCKIIIVYQPPTVLNPDGSLQCTQDDNEIALFSQLCEENDIIFVDVTPMFEKLYEEQHILAHGFTNTAVGVGHLNAYGHGAVAEAVAQAIKEAQ